MPNSTETFFSINEFAIWLNDQKHDKTFVICDNNTSKFCLPLLLRLRDSLIVIEIKNGEQHKTLGDCELIWEELMQKGATRSSLIINLGGGMITDIGAFAAATFKRGLNFVNIPTTLLGMVDAAIGSKTGINFKGVKNQIGTFSHPNALVIETAFFNTLPEIELISGLGEVMKYGLIDSPNLFLNSKSHKDFLNKEIIKKCIGIKDDVVKNDPFEHGWRQILNFGHTIGHALESYSLNTSKPLKHGEAVAWGMLAECYLSEQILGFKELEIVKQKTFEIFSYPAFIKEMQSFEQITEYLKHDKKNVANEIRCTLLLQIGKPKTGVSVSVAQIENALLWLQKLK